MYGTHGVCAIRVGPVRVVETWLSPDASVSGGTGNGHWAWCWPWVRGGVVELSWLAPCPGPFGKYLCFTFRSAHCLNLFAAFVDVLLRFCLRVRWLLLLRLMESVCASVRLSVCCCVPAAFRCLRVNPARRAHTSPRLCRIGIGIETEQRARERSLLVGDRGLSEQFATDDRVTSFIYCFYFPKPFAKRLTGGWL